MKKIALTLAATSITLVSYSALSAQDGERCLFFLLNHRITERRSWSFALQASLGFLCNLLAFHALSQQPLQEL